MTMRIEEIEGIGVKKGERLEEIGIHSVEKLLQAGKTKKGRTHLAQQSGIAESTLLEWINMADLFRVRGIAGQFAELLVASGVDTVKELAQRNPQFLHEKLKKINEEKHYTRVVPSELKISNFIKQAKKLTPMITH